MSLLASCAGKDGDPGPAGAAGANGSTGPTGPSGQNLTGTIYGFVNPVDENGSSVAKNGVTVTLEGATSQTATSDANGRFEFLNMRNGTYNLTYTRAGYATARRFAVAHVGGDQPTFLGTTLVTQVSGSLVSNLSFGTASTTFVPATFTLNNPNPANSTYRVSFFASTSPNVTSANGTLLTTFVLNGPGTTNTSFSKTSFTNAGFPVGTTVYVVAYGSAANLASYTDPTTGRFVFTSLSPTPSNVASVVL
ncbi:hypothetical protein GCM10022406_38490 [Hymenobacter algoricola]|uniref:Carboxypeptidase regulatory-like domain-containing protein n=1 Tax=Hymenobacter algoricola TaxID=486267 RepID=A0ABP7NU02_9BACT